MIQPRGLGSMPISRCIYCLGRYQPGCHRRLIPKVPLRPARCGAVVFPMYDRPSTGDGLFERPPMSAIAITPSIPPSLVLDQSLLRQASLRSTGANVHAARGLAGLYTLAHHAGMPAEFEAAERRLRQFVATGIIPETGVFVPGRAVLASKFPT